jgi:hypothetical protein
MSARQRAEAPASIIAGIRGSFIDYFSFAALADIAIEYIYTTRGRK